MIVHENSRRKWVHSGSLIGHKDTVFSLASAPDEKTVASSSRDGSVRIWDRSSRACIGYWDTADGWVRQVFFLDSGKAIAAAGWSKCMIWSPASRNVSTILEGDRITISASPRGTVLSIGTELGEVTLVDSRSIKVIGRLELFDRPTTTVTVSRDDAVVLAAGSGAVAKINVATRSLEWKSEGHDPTILIGQILVLDSLGLVVSCSHDGSARVWDFNTGKAVAVLEDEGGVVAAAISPDGQSLFTQGMRSRLWDTKSWTIRRTLPGEEGVFKAQFLPDGERIIAACPDGCLRMRDTQNGRLLQSLSVSSRRLLDLLLCENAAEVLVCGDDPVCSIWKQTS